MTCAGWDQVEESTFLLWRKPNSRVRVYLKAGYPVSYSCVFVCWFVWMRQGGFSFFLIFSLASMLKTCIFMVKGQRDISG